jgi:hypothetical protein
MTMHRLLACLVLLVGVLAPPPAAAEAMPYADGLLWRLERDEAPPSYLFGTLHSSDERITTLPQPVSEAFEGARTVAVEAVIDNAAILKMTRAMMLPSGERLDAMLTPRQVARLKEAAAHYRMSAAMLARLKPWGVMSLFSLPPAEHLRHAAGKKPLDEALRAQAEAAGKRVLGLETIEEQIDTLDGMDSADQIAMLDSTLVQAGEIERAFARLRDAYLARDLATVYALLNAAKVADTTGAVERFERRLIVDRNQRMAARMEGLLAEGAAFVAVGALHLPGEQGILQLLAQQGYRVTRVY